ncbi:MAG: beta-propeller fold lactonase family protein [bacterium]
MKSQKGPLWVTQALLICLLCLLVCQGCAIRTSTRNGLEGRISILLEMISNGGEEVSITVEGITLTGEQNKGDITVPMREQFMITGSSHQVLLGDFSVPPDRYTGLSLAIGEVFLFTEGSLVPLQLANNHIGFDIDIDIGPWERKSLPVSIACSVEGHGEKRGLALHSSVKKGRELLGLRGLKAYITDEAGNSVVILDRFSGATLGVISVGAKPRGIVIHPDGTRAYIANSGSDSISVMDTLTSEIIDTIFLGLGVAPEGIAMTPDGGLLITANKDSDNVSLIDPGSQRIIEHIPVGLSPSRVAVSPWGDWAYVTNTRSDTLSFIDLNIRRITATVSMRPGPVGLASSPDGDGIYVACRGSDVLQVVDANLKRVIHALPTNGGPIDVVLDHKRGRIYVADSLSNDVCILIESMNMKERCIPVGESPNTMALDDARRLLYVVNQGDGTVSIIDLGRQRIVDTIRAGSKPWGIVLDRFGRD